MLCLVCLESIIYDDGVCLDKDDAKCRMIVIICNLMLRMKSDQYVCVTLGLLFILQISSSFPNAS